MGSEANLKSQTALNFILQILKTHIFEDGRNKKTLSDTLKDIYLC